MTLPTPPDDRNGELSLEEKLRRLNEHHVSTVGEPPDPGVVERAAAAQGAEVDRMLAASYGRAGAPLRDAMQRGLRTAEAMGAEHGQAWTVLGPSAHPGMVTLRCACGCGETKIGMDPADG